MVEGGALLMRYTAYTRIEGSNPSLSASSLNSPLFCPIDLLLAPS